MGSFKKNWADLGFPLFAQNSIDANRTAVEEATRVGEYMVGTLIENRYFNHNVLSTLLRLTTKARRDEWLGDRINTSAPGNPVIKCGLCSMYLPFKKHSAASLIDDKALLDQLRLKAGVTSQTWKNQAPSATRATNLTRKLLQTAFSTITKPSTVQLHKDTFYNQ